MREGMKPNPGAYIREPAWRRTVRRLAQLPFRSVGLDVSRRTDPLNGWRFADLTPADKACISFARPYTMTSLEGLCALINAVKYVAKVGIEGDVVECGVWRGGSMAAAARTLTEMRCTNRRLYLFDTFAGMPEPGEQDVNFAGESAGVRYREHGGEGEQSAWCQASEAEVKQVMSASGYDETRIHLVKGRVEETIPAQAPEKISLLRLDTDFYGSTRHELEHLWPRLSRGGVIIIDDYGHWQGARAAADEYFSRCGTMILLQRVDYSVRLAVRL